MKNKNIFSETNLVANTITSLANIFESFTIKEVQNTNNISRVFLFFSVDLVNSTQFKNKYNEWALVFKNFYDIIESQVKKIYIDARVWKYIGDEVLFYIEVRSLDDILRAPSDLYSAMINAQEIFHSGDENTKCFLYMKGALWIANAIDGNNNETASNIYIELNTGLDFIGIDIDEGFRMSKNAAQGKLILDPKILFLLNENIEYCHRLTEINVTNKVKIVGFEFLKGIWEGRGYPVIWYCNNWDDEDLFLYDEHYSNKFANQYLNNGKNAKNVEYINKIFKDLNFLIDKVNKIKKTIDSNSLPLLESSAISQLTELHCAVVCIDVNSKKALVVKRSDRRNNYKNHWEFGCAKLTQLDTYADKIKKDYEKDFNINIELLTTSQNDLPLPLRVYEIKNQGKIKKGVVFVAKIESDLDSVSISKTQKYSEHRFISFEELNDWNETAVEGFKDSIYKAFKSLSLSD